MGNYEYPLYRRRSVADNERSAVVKVRGQNFDVDNRWIVPYSPILSKAFETHINVAYCNSVKSRKHICKYINKGSDMAVFAVTNANDEITIPDGSLFPLTVHLENGQKEKSRGFEIVQDLNTTIQNFLPGQLDSFESVDTVVNQDDVVNDPMEPVVGSLRNQLGVSLFRACELYVACSRVGNPSSLFIYAPKNKNIVYQKALND
ncbi:hypothetical protein GWI33_004117 [Rhynchophorus ferrugineus]|uniref:Uncharacterized protein n=1 Tax=Rhynchophorus ferrugineus TaxID=354439 RepID=A0A834HJ38_RHYFE|nr:hypothetical protein GWI33_004117 [Rhynchophorus ferrugineus]